MSRSELVRLLALLVRNGQLTTEQAREVVRQFDAGLLTPDQLPLPLAEATRLEDGLVAAALLAVALLFGRTNARRLVTAQPGIPLFVRKRARDSLRGGFERTVTGLTTELARTGNIASWHSGMAAATRAHIARQYVAGVGRPLTATETQALQGTIREQMVFLQRFATQATAKQAIGTPMSMAYLRQRSEQYAGAGLGSWFRGSEAADGEVGYVYDYQTRDDPRVCGPCGNAGSQGPYLAGDGPMPGEVCVARGKCRCQRVRRYDAEAYARLTGRQLAA